MERGGTPALSIDGLHIDLVFRRVYQCGCACHLSRRQWKLLQLLVEANGRVLAYDDLLRSLWGSERRDRMTSLRRVVQHLRWKIELDARHPVHILTEARIGYRFVLHGHTQYGA